jgi:hypothetical protein
VCFALALASKQHVVLLVPVFAMWPAFGVRRTLASVGLAAVAVLPWVLAGPRDFWHDAVHANLSLGLRADALDLPAVLDHHGANAGFWLAALFLVVAYILVFVRAPRTPAGLAISASFVMWAFDVANRQTYFNHYQLPLGLLVLGIGLAGAEDASQVDRPEVEIRRQEAARSSG